MNESFTNLAGNASARPARGPRRAPGRAGAIAEAALRVLTRQGWRLAGVAEVAREAGIAAGTVYLYAAEKEALLDLALRAAAGLTLPPEGAPPLVADVPGTLGAALATFRAPILAAAAEGAPVTLDALLAELHDLLAAQRRLILLLDRLSPELPVVAEAYGRAVRGAAFGRFAAAVARLAEAGAVRRDLPAEAASRAVLEMLAWTAMRRPADPLPQPCDEATARATALALARAALAP
jgi:AcrR family transcriptional regulator